MNQKISFPINPASFVQLRIVAIIFINIFFSWNAQGQVVYTHVSNTGIYDFIDELANEQIISANTAIRPYPRIFIAAMLDSANHYRDRLNARQQKDLDFYLRDYNKELLPGKNFRKRHDLFYYKDTLFTVTVNPILGISYFTNDSGSFYHRWNGGELYGYIGPHVGFYASLRDNHESRRLSDPQYLNRFDASSYKVDTKGGGDFDEMRGGITYGWMWGSAGLVKDHFVWGDNYNGANIFSGHQPSFTSIKLQLKPVSWLDFNYFHGWLVSDVIDSSKSYPNGASERLVFRSKYIASNMYTVTPWKGLNISLGNSIVYSDQNIHPAYLIPFFFFKTIDHSLSSTGSNYLGQNSQMFFNISSRNVRKLHLYTSVFIDEISLGRFTDEKTQTNFASVKIGARYSNILDKNIALTVEYTRTNPITYRHYLLTGTFASTSYNMGHYLGDNAQEIFLALTANPFSKLKVEVSYSIAQKGEMYLYTGNSRDSVGNGMGKPFLKRVLWEMSSMELRAHYQLTNDFYFFAGVQRSNSEGLLASLYTMPYFRGKQTTVNVGVNVGF